MVFPRARDLVDRIQQVQSEIRWELFVIRLLRGDCFGGHLFCNGRLWDVTITYLQTWCRALRDRRYFPQNNYDGDQVVDVRIRDLVIEPEDESARLLPSVRTY